ncbi:MAG TPA: flavodoxin reductase [Marinobacter sp.]|nr:flavodoxin reductase [Marinobacter sp.]
MKNERVKIRTIKHLTHDVLGIVTDKPTGADFKPGQATEIFIDKAGWEKKGRPFTFTCTPQEDYLEFAIKTYPAHKGVTNELLTLKAGDSLIVNDIFGAIRYKGEGTFIAGGAGITPFIAIFRDLKAKNALGNNRLIFANKTVADIILRDELQSILGDKFINILSDEKTDQYANGLVSEEFIKNSGAALESYFYVCAPPPMMDAVGKQLAALKVPEERIVKEAF